MNWISSTRMLLVLACTILCFRAAEADQYVGFGAVTQGADSCPSGAPETYRVTTLNNSGTGSFRESVSQNCRHIVFDVGGTINLSATLQISTSYLTIDGSTSPAPGITLSIPGQRIAFEARNSQAVHDIIVNNIRTVGSGGGIETKDHWELDGSSGAPVFNIVLDHMTMRSSSDGSVDIYGDVYNITLSNSLLWDSIQGHHFSKSDGERDAITVYRNVYAKNNERQPRIRYNTTRIEFVNNVIYGWGWFEGGAAGMHLEIGGSQFSPSANVENNIFHYVSGLSGSPDNALRITGTLYGDWFFTGNRWPTGENDAVSTSSRISIPTAAQVERLSVAALGDSVVPCAGTQLATAEERDLLDQISLAVGGTATECVQQSSGPRPKPPTNLQAN